MSKCSFCGSPNTNSRTCPNNPKISLNKMNFNKHINANTKLVTTLIEDFHSQNMFVILMPPHSDYENLQYFINQNLQYFINQNLTKYQVPNNINNNNLQEQLNLLDNELNSLSNKLNNTHSYVKHLINKKNRSLRNKNINLLNKTLTIYVFRPTLNPNTKQAMLDEGKFKFVFYGDLLQISNVYKIDNTSIITVGEPSIQELQSNIVFSLQSLKSLDIMQDFIKEQQISQLVSDKNIGPKLYYCHVIDNTYNPLNNQNFPQINDFPEIIQRFKKGLLNKISINRSSSKCRNIFIEHHPIGIFIMEKLSKTFRYYCRNGLENRTNNNKNIGNNITIKCTKVCEKIRELENCGIIHNDLHSNNIMFDKYGEPKIIDYGRSYHLPGIINHNQIIKLLNIRRKIAGFVNNFIDEFNSREPSNNLVYNLSNDLDFTVLLNNLSSFLKNKVINKYITYIKKIYQYYIIQNCIIYPETFIPYLTREEGGTFNPKCLE